MGRERLESRFAWVGVGVGCNRSRGVDMETGQTQRETDFDP